MKKALYMFAGFMAAVTLFSAIINVTANKKTEDWWDMENTEVHQIEEVEEDFDFKITYYYEDDTYISESEIESIIEPIVEGPAQEDKDLSYVIMTGDSWWKIAETFYGDGDYYIDIAKYNNLDPDAMIYVGQIITIPSINNITNSKVASTDNYKSSATEEKVIIDAEEYEYIGAWNITGYDIDCAHCCGGNTYGIGATGSSVTPGYSVATKDLPLGVTLYIEGYGYYVNEDRGCEYGIIDIAASSHEECYALTSDYPVDVYIVK